MELPSISISVTNENISHIQVLRWRFLSIRSPWWRVWRVFGEEGGDKALGMIISIIISQHGNENAINFLSISSFEMQII